MARRRTVGVAGMLRVIAGLFSRAEAWKCIPLIFGKFLFLIIVAAIFLGCNDLSEILVPGQEKV